MAEERAGWPDAPRRCQLTVELELEASVAGYPEEAARQARGYARPAVRLAPEEARREHALAHNAAAADSVDPAAGAPAGRWNREATMVALTNRPPETIYPVNTRLILPFFAEEGEQGRPPLHGRITAFIPGRGAYADPLVPFHPRTGREEDLPHYMID